MFKVYAGRRLVGEFKTRKEAAPICYKELEKRSPNCRKTLPILLKDERGITIWKG